VIAWPIVLHLLPESPKCRSRGRDHDRQVSEGNRPEKGANPGAFAPTAAATYVNLNAIGRLTQSAKEGRHGIRDYALLLITYRQGLRVSDAVGLRLDNINLKEARIWIKRVKNSLSTEQPILGDELRALKRYLATREDKLAWLFVSERGGPMVRRAVNHMIVAA
jgi:integrase